MRFIAIFTLLIIIGAVFGAKGPTDTVKDIAKNPKKTVERKTKGEGSSKLLNNLGLSGLSENSKDLARKLGL